MFKLSYSNTDENHTKRLQRAYKHEFNKLTINSFVPVVKRIFNLLETSPLPEWDTFFERAFYYAQRADDTLELAIDLFVAIKQRFCKQVLIPCIIRDNALVHLNKLDFNLKNTEPTQHSLFFIESELSQVKVNSQQFTRFNILLTSLFIRQIISKDLIDMVFSFLTNKVDVDSVYLSTLFACANTLLNYGYDLSLFPNSAFFNRYRIEPTKLQRINGIWHRTASPAGCTVEITNFIISLCMNESDDHDKPNNECYNQLNNPSLTLFNSHKHTVRFNQNDTKVHFFNKFEETIKIDANGVSLESLQTNYSSDSD